MDKSKKIEDVVEGLGKLPTLPVIAMRILEAVGKDETSLNEIADILSTDPPLSIEVLKATNSPLYGLPTKITSVPHAANLLGISTIKSLALSFSLVKNYGFADKLNVNEIGHAINRQTQHSFALFDIDLDEDKNYDELLDAAQAELANLSKDLLNELLEKRCEIESLKRQVAQDSMTKLINHQHFNELLEQEISRSERYNRPLSIIIADIDHFKSINDTFGHPVGDLVIKTVADSLRSELRESDHVARYGGDEFAVILPETPLDNALAAAEKLREAIESLKVVCDNKDILVTMSFGVSTIPITHKISRDELKKRADSALYEAKKQGRNRCCIFELH